MELRRQPAQAGARERRVAVALEHEIAAPDGADLLALSEHVGLDPEPGAEQRKRRVRDGELLGRGRSERRRGVPGEDGAARVELDRERGGAGTRNVRDREGLRELSLEAAVGASLRRGGGRERRENGCGDERDEAGGAAHSAAILRTRPGHVKEDGSGRRRR